MAVHVFSQKIKNFYTIAIYFNTTRDIYFDIFCAVLGESGTCFYLMIMVTCIYRSQQIAQICISSSLYTESSHDFPLVSGYFDSAYYILWFWYVCVTQTRCFLCLKEIHKTNFVSDQRITQHIYCPTTGNAHIYKLIFKRFIPSFKIQYGVSNYN